ncbi:uncharacterized protein EAF02_009568 [Botrytis sinoallii]|uniref:uncharacterized protein n=1 Tax=Botrytis sinoallii TaxID=1463999 RepID=UPI0018FF243D|nr:uncharacterized protein EAF02_009568 [Botrytis sinoallii]KAF7868832.1 hypothetical protein EAF02_009568 [Botrytis sinoallii]
MHLSKFIIFLAAVGNSFVMASPTLRSEGLSARSVNDSLHERTAIDNIGEKREETSIDADAAYGLYED